MTVSNEALTPFAHTAQNRCFGCGPANPNGLHLEFLLAEDHSVVSMASIPDSFEGAPGYLHGGIIATLLDEAMSKSVRARGFIAMTRHMEIDYLRPAPLYQPLVLVGRHLRRDGRKLFHQAELQLPDGKVLARSKGLFIAIDDKILADAGFPPPNPGS